MTTVKQIYYWNSFSNNESHSMKFWRIAKEEREAIFPAVMVKDIQNFLIIKVKKYCKKSSKKLKC